MVSGRNRSINENKLFSSYYWTRFPIELVEECDISLSRFNMNGTINNDFADYDRSYA